MNDQSILKILEEQHDHLKQHKYKSYDLCDITSQSYFLKMNDWCYGKSFGKYIKYPHELLLKYFTPLLRRVYRIEKQDFAQSNSFVVRGLLQLYRSTNESSYLFEAKSLISRISEQKSTGFQYSCWGQPYDWFSKKIIPAYTPRTTVTSQIGRMFLDAYDTTNDSSYLDAALDIGNFFIHEMPLSYSHDQKTCFSYTTIDQHQVHNPNMMAGGFLAFLWHYTKEDKYLDRALSAASFTFSEMNLDGSWYYAKLPNNTKSKIDNYHTGYNIEGALMMSKYLGEHFLFNTELKKSINYYLKNLFSQTGIPFLTDKKKFPIDIQCCAQSIITFSFLANLDPKYINTAKKLFKWTSHNMYHDGSYYYRIFKNGSIDKTDYIRWGDSWMFYAASLLLTSKHD